MPHRYNAERILRESRGLEEGLEHTTGEGGQIVSCFLLAHHSRAVHGSTQK